MIIEADRERATLMEREKKEKKETSKVRMSLEMLLTFRWQVASLWPAFGPSGLFYFVLCALLAQNKKIRKNS